MAAVPITLVGMATDESGASHNITFVGMASLTGLSVGGGPARPPLGFWGGRPPEYPDIGGPGPQPPTGGGEHPSHPIELPPPQIPPPEGPPDENGFIKPPPQDGGWAYHSEYGWGMYPAPGQPTPKSGA